MVLYAIIGPDEENSGLCSSCAYPWTQGLGYGIDSTSHIESLWSNIKSLIKSFYTVILSENFVLFLKEGEFRRNVKKFKKEAYITKFEEKLIYISNIYGNKFN